MPNFKIRYTSESWREVIVEADNERHAREGFFLGEGVDWSTDHEYDAYIDYDNLDVKEIEE